MLVTPKLLAGKINDDTTILCESELRPFALFTGPSARRAATRQRFLSTPTPLSTAKEVPAWPPIGPPSSAAEASAGRHFHGYHHPQTQLVAIAEIDEQKLEEAGKTNGVDRLYTDYRELLERERARPGERLHHRTTPP